MEPKLLRIADAAKLMSISRSAAYLLAQRGEIPTVRVGHSVRVPIAALEEWLAARTRQPAA